MIINILNISFHTSLFCIQTATKVAVDWGRSSINKYGCTKHGASPAKTNVNMVTKIEKWIAFAYIIVHTSQLHDTRNTIGLIPSSLV